MTPAEILAAARPDIPRRLFTWRPFRIEDVYEMVRADMGDKQRETK